MELPHDISIPALETYLAQAAPEAHTEIATLYDKWLREKRKALARLDCQGEGNWGPTSQLEKEKSGVLFSYLDGKKRLISVNSFYAHLIDRVIRSHPVDGSTTRATATRTRFVRRTEENSKNSEVGA
jgi:hypothetical protein